VFYNTAWRLGVGRHIAAQASELQERAEDYRLGHGRAVALALGCA